jgi:hypothetical protein
MDAPHDNHEQNFLIFALLRQGLAAENGSRIQRQPQWREIREA